MTHISIRKKLSAFLDGELPDEEMVEIENHLDHCADCREEFGEICKGQSLVRSLEEVELPDVEKSWYKIRLSLTNSSKDQNK